MKYKSGQNESIFDVALATGGMDGLASLLKGNPSLIQNDGSITQGRVTHTVTGDESAGGTLATTVADPVFSTATPATVTAGSSDETVRTNGRTRMIKSGQNQTLFDIASRYGGLGLIITDNPGLIQNDGSVSQYRVDHRVQEVTGASTEIERINQERNSVEKVEGDPLYLSGSRQTVFDVCLTQYGGIEALPYLLADNPNGVKSDGNFRQFREAYNIRKLSFVNLGIKAKMLILRPESGSPATGGAWVTEDGQDWWTNDNQSWLTQQ